MKIIRNTRDWLGLIGGTAVFAGTLTYIGHRMDIGRAWHNIGLERQPRLIE